MRQTIHRDPVCGKRLNRNKAHIAIHYALFDLDDTLYPPAAGLMKALGQRMTQYMVERLHIEAPKAEALRKFYNERYGSTTRGMVIHHGVDLQGFLHWAISFPQSSEAGPPCGSTRASKPLKKWIMSLAICGRWVMSSIKSES